MSPQTLLEAMTYVRVASVADVPPGWVLKVTVGARVLALANVEGTFYAFDNACAHAGGSLGDGRLQHGCLVQCPWHNSMFDVRTGEAERGPARKALRTYPVRVEGDVVSVALDDARVRIEGGDSSNGSPAVLPA